MPIYTHTSHIKYTGDSGIVQNLQRLFALVVFCVIVLGCDLGEPNSTDLLLIKVQERLLHGQLVLGPDVKNAGYSSSGYRKQVLQPMIDKVNEYRKRVPVTDKLRESNVIKHIKSRMNDPDSFRLGSISYKPDYGSNYSEHGYLIATVEYYGKNVFNATIKQKVRYRVTPHGFPMATIE